MNLIVGVFFFSFGGGRGICGILIVRMEKNEKHNNDPKSKFFQAME